MQLKWPMRWDLFSLFPAYAGVILCCAIAAMGSGAFPRIRGGDPTLHLLRHTPKSFSPHTRG